MTDAQDKHVSFSPSSSFLTSNESAARGKGKRSEKLHTVTDQQSRVKKKEIEGKKTPLLLYLVLGYLEFISKPHTVL